MEKRSNERKKSKTDAMSIRFPIPFWEKLQQKHGIKSATDAAVFFERMYGQVFESMVGNPVLDRNIVQPDMGDGMVLNSKPMKAFDPERTVANYSKGGGAKMVPAIAPRTRQEVENQIKEWEGTECPKGFNKAKFEAKKAEKLASLQEELKTHH